MCSLQNAVQCRTASKHDRLQYKSRAPFATVQQCHLTLHFPRYTTEKCSLFTHSLYSMCCAVHLLYLDFAIDMITALHSDY